MKKMSGTTREGKKVYAVHLVKSIDENTYEWRAHGREMDGAPLPKTRWALGRFPAQRVPRGADCPSSAAERTAPPEGRHSERR